MKTIKRSPIALAILAMLYEAPMHPYRMQQLIKERGKDEVINVAQRASLYQTVNRLEREGLIASQGVSRDENRPERTIYELSPAGRAIMLQWMREILSTPSQEFPDFPAAISFLPLLTPDDARQQLEQRAVALQAEIDRIEQNLRHAIAMPVPRLFLLEMEYLNATYSTQLAWVRAVIADLQSGKLTWSEAWLRQIAMELSQPSEHSSS
ncbi:PadR family transcriptional regulator [Phyllobacterium myrsinacearum]|uniref:PadR family transcriptional regulator n=1 Tax=Phyllobacterium myrsinacearum TaxID=28101 RepID=A0A2S9JFK4_9HYPH|nr:PadR family transcriptional regulator [Phyllobacterium myrsinacearum]PRD51697.1 PadR family transcriptional regulator [Phyllobacterium myrsinacearum]PWV86253.1 PadR family transcriptional regulator [Phyllobacterium myrsinacearum]RZU99977.1 DNA-binding PadR family transcriptional regulator [Phyllobacterium myrsinacearum]